MLNLPLGDTLGVRVAGNYLNRDGYTNNMFNNSRIDGRDLYAVRGTLSLGADRATPRVDLIGYYFHENDNRSRIQKQLCHRDPTGVLGCLPDRLAYETVNANSTLSPTLASREFLSSSPIGAAGPALAPFGAAAASTATDIVRRRRQPGATSARSTSTSSRPISPRKSNIPPRSSTISARSR